MELLKDFIDSIRKFTDAVIVKITKLDKWKLYLYYQGQCIDKRYVDDDFNPIDNLYIVKTFGKKHLFGTNMKVQIIFKYYKYKLTDNDNKEVHIEVINFEGGDLTS